MPSTSSGSNSNIVDTLRELEDHLDLAIREAHSEVSGGHSGNREVVPHQSTVDGVAPVAESVPVSPAGKLQSEAARESASQAAQPEITPETAQPVETGVEEALEQYTKVDEEHPEESPYVIRKAATAQAARPVQPVQKSQQQVDVEEILAADLSSAFRQMSPAEQERFRRAGEETASKIATLIEKAKITARKVLALIRDWLKLIPGVNRFFLEQEVKIKTEEILRYEREYKHKRKSAV